MTKTKSVLLLLVVVVLGWAEPLRAQALNLPIGPTLNGALGVNTFTLQATGGTAPYHYSITPGFTPPPGFRVQDGPPLPTNFTVSPSGTGGFLGVATTSGTFTTSIRATDATAAFIDKPITLNIPPLQFSINPPKMTLNVAYSYTFTGFGGSGGSGYSWSATNLPTGMNLSAGGVLSGTPTAIPVGNAVVTLTDSTLSPPLNSLQRQVTITVDPWAITTPGLLPTATANVFYNQTLSAPGCTPSCVWTPTSFAGVTLNSAGVLTGTPFLQTGSFTATALATNGTGPVSKVFSLFVTSPSTPLSSGFGGFGDQTVGNFITASILPFGGTPPYSASLVSGTLPPGISLVGPGETICNNCAPSLPYLAGRAMQVGTYTFTLKLMDSAGGSFTPPPYTWNISPLSNQYFTLPLAGTTLVVGTPYTQPLLVFGGSNTFTFQAFNALPDGLSIDPNTGVISGTPTTGGNLTTQIRISDGGIVKFTAFIAFNVTGPPTVVTNPATNVSDTNATLNGTVNAAGLATTGNFEWGTTTAYGNTTPVLNFGSGFFTQNTSRTINITCVAGSIYHYRVRATNSQGTSFGADQTFSCSPQVNTFDADNINAVSARLNGSVDPNGVATTAWFQWGTTTGYGNITPILSVGSGTSSVSIPGGNIAGLTCSTLYHFRAVASSANGTSVGADVTFTTNTCSPSAFTGVATLVGLTNATLLGAVNPNGTATNAHFEWGTTTGYGNSTPLQSMGAGLATTPLTAVPIAGLTCNTTYHFRVAATNSFGTANGLDGAFKTAPCTPSAFTGIVYTLNGYPFTNLIYASGVSASGALTQLPGFPMPTGGVGESDSTFDEAAEQLAYDGVTHRLYAINTASNTLSAFSVNPATGALSALPFSPIALPPGLWLTVHVHPSGSPVIVGGGDVNFATGLVVSYVVTPTTATPAAGSPYAMGVGGFSSAFSRDGNYLYLGSGDGNGADPSTAGFSVAPATGVLTPLAGSPFALGGMYPIGYATDASGRMFVANNLGNQLRAFTTSNGVPTAVAGSPFAAAGLGNIQAGVLHPSGFYMVANRGRSSGGQVGVFQVAGTGPATTLTNVAGSPFSTGGFDAITLTLSKNGGLLFVANSLSLNLTVFGVNSGTGALTSLFVQPESTLGNTGLLSGVAFASSSSPFGDFNADAKGDLLLRNKATGQDIGWLMNGLTVSTSAFMPTIADTNWKIVGRGDFDGDGKADVILRNSANGQDIGWLMNGLTVSTSAFMPTIADTNWEIRGVGDFDGDGKADVILRNKFTGQDIGWLMNGLTVANAAFMPTIADTNWEIVGVGDFDGDGKSDVLLRNKSTGQNIGWLMNGLTVANAAFMPTIADTNWEIKGVGDFNGDGKADVVLRNKVTGADIGWLMNGLTVSTSAFLPTIADTNWEIKGTGDFDGDGKADIILRNKLTGQDIGWIMNGLTVSTSAFMPTIADTNWEFVGQGQ